LGPRIGLAWAAGGSPEFGRKSLHLADFACLGAVPDVTLVSLQKGSREEEIRQAPAGMSVERPALKDLLATASVIADLDLVISVDTAVAHLAGAMGKPVWTLLPYPADWRWLIGRDASPWYPSMKLFASRSGAIGRRPLTRSRPPFANAIPGLDERFVLGWELPLGQSNTSQPCRRATKRLR
jgi:hypothetical protein